MIKRHNDTSKKVPFFSGMSYIEKFVMIMSPIGITYMIYVLSSFLEYVLWIRLSISIGISIGISVILLLLIFLFADFMSKRDSY